LPSGPTIPSNAHPLPAAGRAPHVSVSQGQQGSWSTQRLPQSQPPLHQFRAPQPPPTSTHQYPSGPHMPPSSMPAEPPFRQQLDPAVRHKMTSGGKLFIDEPPSKRAAAAAAAAAAAGALQSGFQSPIPQYGGETAHFHEDVRRINYEMHMTAPGVVRRVVRDNWQKTLLGSDFHQAFIVG
jgi:hypothetical protein